ncbi:hypothetical protein C8J57DRAFT_1540559 [Mycena rebaudengoi]|nr:hypothetical protein C8J57DRAFT_1540559 [Mycena rebaudengoi]
MTNVVWPQGDRFFLPDGGLLRFLRENMRFKRVVSLPAAKIMDLCRCMKELVRHMFFTVQIRQNEFRILYDPVPVPSEAAWMFHVILCLLRIIGFENNKDMLLKTDQPFKIGVTEMQLAEAQAKFLLGAVLQTYVDNVHTGAHSPLDYKTYNEYGWVDKNFESLDIEDILGAWRARYHAEGPHKSPGVFQMLKATVSIERQEREEVELMRAIIAASTVQSIAAESSLSMDKGYESADEDEAEMAAVYAMQKAWGSISSDDSLPALISVPSSSLEL